jgi:pepF/M3 family oligoendopeptidase
MHCRQGKKMNNNKRESTPPHWNIASIYPGLESPEYKKALEDYESLMNESDSILEAAQTLSKNAASPNSQTSGFDFPLWLSRYLELENKLGALEESLNAFAYAIYSTETTNAQYINNLSRLEELGLRSKNQDGRFMRILSVYAEKLEEFYTRFAQFAEYKYVLSHTLMLSYHLMSENEENLANDLGRTGAGAWTRLHEQIISNLQDSESGKMFNEIRNEAYHADRNVRKAAWQSEIKLLRAMEIPLASCLNNLKGSTCTLNRRRGWDDAILRSLHSSRMSAKTLSALIAAIEDSLPAWRGYLKTKARLIAGTSAEKNAAANNAADEGLAFYDLFAPLSANAAAGTGYVDKIWTFSEARTYIIERFFSFSKDMGNFAKHAFDAGWIDAELRKGKVGGAYCMDFPRQKESRVLSNFTGVFSDVSTLAHELGHAYHYSKIKDSDYALQHYPMTLAETASIFAELIVMEDAIAHSEGFEKVRLIEVHLQDVCQVLVDILSRYYFEKSVFAAREEGELSALDFCRLMTDAQERTYGDGLSSERHEYMWAIKSHYYSPGLDFYNFPYAFGQLFGAALYNRCLSEGDSFAQSYAALLKQTGSASCESVCRKAGFDIEAKEFWELGINRFKSKIKILQASV